MAFQGDPAAEWNKRVQAKVDRGMSNAEATQAVAKEDPELRRAYVAAHNLKHGRPVAAGLYEAAGG